MMCRSASADANHICGALPSVSGAQMNMTHFKMQGLPLPWLSQLVSTISEQKSKNCLFETCTLLRDLTLAKTDRVQCLLLPSVVNPTKAARSLQLLDHCRQDADVKVVLQVRSGEAEYQQAEHLTSWLNNLYSELGSPLASIKRVDLQGDVLGDIVPAGLQAICPNLTHLTRQGWFPDLPHHASGLVQPCQLQHLTILGFRDVQPVEALQAQFKALPNVQSVHCTFVDTVDAQANRQAQEDFQQSIGPLHMQLQSFTVLPSVEHFVLDELFAEPWLLLKTLRIPGARVNDDQLGLLLRRAPQVTELDVLDFDLRDSFAHRQCMWRQLTIDYLDCDSLVKLPVGALHTLHIGHISLMEFDWPHFRAAAAILANIPKIQTMQDKLVLSLGDATEAQVADIVAVLQHLPRGHVRVEFAAPMHSPPRLCLQVLGQLQCQALTVQVYDFKLPQDCWGTLLQQLPQLHVLHVCHGLPTSLNKDVVNAHIHRLSTSCKLADRPCTLQIEHVLAQALGPGWQDQLNASMRAAGHQHVHIEVV